MSYYVYHSKNRESDPQKLGEYDLIITTYTIVAAELHRTRTRKNDAGSPFENINFFRIVLDEAHAIREQSTLQSKSICMLSSPRRWAVTGTPIQNKLEDFGSLLRFIRLSPFDTHFRQTIIGPFKMAEPNVIPRLRLLVDSVTLRRTKERIDLPERFDFTRELTLSEREEKLYRWFATDARRKVKAIAAQEKLGGKRWHVSHFPTLVFEIAPPIPNFLLLNPSRRCRIITDELLDILENYSGLSYNLRCYGSFE